jgi:hypothetical protein
MMQRAKHKEQNARGMSRKDTINMTTVAVAVDWRMFGSTFVCKEFLLLLNFS